MEFNDFDDNYWEPDLDPADDFDPDDELLGEMLFLQYMHEREMESHHDQSSRVEIHGSILLIAGLIVIGFFFLLILLSSF